MIIYTVSALVPINNRIAALAPVAPPATGDDVSVAERAGPTGPALSRLVLCEPLRC